MRLLSLLFRLSEQNCNTGCIIITPDLGNESILGIVNASELSFAAWKGQVSIALLIQKSESNHLLERLGGASDLPVENSEANKRKRQAETEFEHAGTDRMSLPEEQQGDDNQ